ncbi:MAG: hypothetical protein AAF702_45270 [Chloroflexota bacterium]
MPSDTKPSHTETEVTQPRRRIKRVTPRPLLSNEKRVIDFFDDIETKSVDTLEAGAKEIIRLVTGFLGLLLGIVSLGSASVAPILQLTEIKIGALAAILLLLVALASALVTVMPRSYQVRYSSLDDKMEAYELMLERKSIGLQVAVFCFGLGLVTFAGLIVLFFV